MMMSNLVDHARKELELIYGTGPSDGEFDTVGGVLKVMQAFADMGHSGGSAMVVIPWINALLQFQNLTPLTNDPAEWTEVFGNEMYQSTRRSDAFCEDGGKTYYLLDEKRKLNWRGKRTRKVMHRSKEA